MARFYRVMLPEGDYPRVGDRKLLLGVRVGKPPHGDVELTGTGTVVPKSGGMSVVRHWKDLPYFLIPPRLRHLVSQPTKQRAIQGNDEARCWFTGEGEFANSRLNDQLSLRLDSNTHGLIEPTVEVAIAIFQESLAITRTSWMIDEE